MQSPNVAETPDRTLPNPNAKLPKNSISVSRPPAAEAVVESLTEFGKPPSEVQSAVEYPSVTHRELRSANACSTSLLKSPCDEKRLDARCGKLLKCL